MFKRFLISLTVAVGAAGLYRASTVDYPPFGVLVIPAWQAVGCAAAVVFAVAWIALRWLSPRWAVACGVIAAFTPPLWCGASDGADWLLYAGAVAIGALVLNKIAFLLADKAFGLEDAAFIDRMERLVGEDSEAEMQKRKVWHVVFAAFCLIGAGFIVHSVLGFRTRDGEGACVYARDIVEANAAKWIVSDGIAEKQLAWAVGKVASTGPFILYASETDDSRSNLVQRVAERWPGKPTLTAAAKIGRTAFVNAAIREVPDEIHIIGPGATNEALSVALAAWNRRWEHLKPIIRRGKDPFCQIGRLAFAREGNHLGGRLQTAGENEQASKIYRQVAFEIEPDNISACVNIVDMARRKVWKGTENEREHAAEIIRLFMGDRRKMTHREEIVRRAGPVHRPPDLKRPVLPEAWQRIGEKNNRMLEFLEKGDLGNAGALAREMLSVRRTENAVPANIVMATVLLAEGDSAASETFFRRALAATTNEVPAIVCNNFAVALQKNGKFEEAERYAREAVRKFAVWQFLDTLASVLIDRGQLAEAREVFERATRQAHQYETNGNYRAELSATRDKLTAAEQ